MNPTDDPCMSVVLDDRTLTCMTHPGTAIGCRSLAHHLLCTSCHARASRGTQQAPMPPLCPLCTAIDEAAAIRAGVPFVVQSKRDRDVWAQTNRFAQVRFLELWLGVVPWQVETVTVTMPPSGGRGTRELPGVRWEDWLLAVQDSHERRVAEFAQWSAQIDPIHAADRTQALEDVAGFASISRRVQIDADLAELHRSVRWAQEATTQAQSALLSLQRELTGAG